MVDLFSLFVVPAAQAAVGWGTKRALDVLFDCSECDERRRRARIDNISFNELDCPNCHATSRQFVNVCSFTVGRDGRIGQIGLALDSDYHYERSFGTRTAIYVPGTYLFVGLAGKSVVETNSLYDYETGKRLHAHDCVWTIRGAREERDMRLRAYLREVPADEFYGQTMRLETVIRDAHKNVLFTDDDVCIPRAW